MKAYTIQCFRSYTIFFLDETNFLWIIFFINCLFSPGNFISNMGHTIIHQDFLGSREHGGFLFLRPTFQCLNTLSLPEAPYLFGLLLQKWELPWAKVFPIRLLLRLGAEYRCKSIHQSRSIKYKAYILVLIFTWVKNCGLRDRLEDLWFPNIV